jgi:cytochrome c oxidase assembly protein subunit 15
LFENALMVQFNHRMLAYALWFVSMLHLADIVALRRGGPTFIGALALASAVTIQAGIGIATLLHHAPFALALLHQVTAVLLLTIAVVHAQRLAPRRERAGAAAPLVAGSSVARGTQ